MLRPMAGLLGALFMTGCTAARSPTALSADAPMVCIASYAIDHTDIPDDGTILFTMRDHTVWANHLQGRCVGLRNDPLGFTYTATDPGSDSICSNLVTIRLNTYGGICLLGAFVKVAPHAAGKAMPT